MSYIQKETTTFCILEATNVGYLDIINAEDSSDRTRTGVKKSMIPIKDRDVCLSTSWRGVLWYTLTLKLSLNFSWQ
jgi:hypothetical protein